MGLMFGVTFTTEDCYFVLDGDLVPPTEREMRCWTKKISGFRCVMDGHLGSCWALVYDTLS